MRQSSYRPAAPLSPFLKTQERVASKGNTVRQEQDPSGFPEPWEGRVSGIPRRSPSPRPRTKSQTLDDGIFTSAKTLPTQLQDLPVVGFRG
jgi:hypothetical protein